MTKIITVIGEASTTGLTSHFELAQDESEEVYTNTKIVVFSFTWLLLAWKITNTRKLITITTAIQSLLIFAQIFAPSTEGLLLIRSLLGITGAIFPGAILSILESSNKNLGVAVAGFVAVSPFEKSTIGPLISVMANLIHNTSRMDWRAIFAFQGILGLCIAVIVWVGHGISERCSASENLKESSNSVDWKHYLMLLFKLKNIYAIAIFICCNLSVASAPSYLTTDSRTTFAYVPYFFFTIFADLGPSHLTFNILLICPYLLSILAIFMIANLSDRLHTRSYIAVTCMFISSLGFSVMSAVAHFGWNEWWSYFAIYPACIGFYGAITITIVWAVGNESSDIDRGVIVTMLLGAGQLAAMFSPAGIKPWWRAVDEPQHPRGLGMCAAMMAAGLLIAFGLHCHLARMNCNKERYFYAPLVDGYPLNETDNDIEESYIL